MEPKNDGHKKEFPFPGISGSMLNFRGVFSHFKLALNGMAPNISSLTTLDDLDWLVVEPTHLKNMIVKLGSSSPNRDENKTYLKPPPINTSSSEWLRSYDLSTGSHETRGWALMLRCCAHGAKGKMVQNSQLTGAPSTKCFFFWLGTLTWNIKFLKMKTRSSTSCFFHSLSHEVAPSSDHKI